MQHTIPVVGFVSLGCPKALVDTERIVTELRARGYRIGRSYHDADLVIVNRDPTPADAGADLVCACDIAAAFDF